MMATRALISGVNPNRIMAQSRIGSVYHVRGVVHGIITVEAIRTAQAKFGKRALTSDEVRWGLEHLNLDDGRLKAINALGLMPATKISCADHEGSGLVKFQQWDGKQWHAVTDWISGDRAMTRPMVEESAAKYAKEKNITPRDCGKEA